MYEYFPLAIGILAILVAVVRVKGFRLLKLSMAIFALSSGEIHLAIFALVLLLLVENDWRIDLPFKSGAVAACGIVLAWILIVTAINPMTGRVYSELLQLSLYLFLFVSLATYLRTGEDVQRLLIASILGCCAGSILALFSLTLDWTSSPHIFIGRGSNEGSIFLALVGVVPSAVMLARTRNPIYLLAAGLLVYLQFLATSRGSMAVSALALLIAGYFWTRLLVARVAILLTGLAVLFRSVPQLLRLYEAQINFSALERLALIEHGLALADQKPWTGWGWGSAFDLAGSMPNTVQIYPHFHNTYIQLIVEVGILGWIILGFFVTLFLRWGWLATKRIKQPAVAALITCTGVCLAVAFIFDSMLFGADRSVQVIILMALCSRTISLAATSQALPILPSRKGIGAHAGGTSEIPELIR